jgi:hypothetical protein
MHVRHARVFQIFGKQKILFIKNPINNLLPCKQFLVDATPVVVGFAVATVDARWSSLSLTNHENWHQE